MFVGLRGDTPNETTVRVSSRNGFGVSFIIGARHEHSKTCWIGTTLPGGVETAGVCSMSDRSLPIGLVAARRSPLFDPASLPSPLLKSHRTAVWAELRVQAGSVRFIDLEGRSPRDEQVQSGGCAVIAPGVGHRVEPSDDGVFYLQFYRELEAPVNTDDEADGSSHLTGM